MAHYAFIDKNNIVVEVITGRDEWEVIDDVTDWEAYYTSQREGLRALRTSYNTQGGQHTKGGTPFRGNYAGLGSHYDENLDVFVPPKPYLSWVLDESTYNWVAPLPYPGDATKDYSWDEEKFSWAEIIWEAPVAYPEDGGVYDWDEDSQAWVERV